VKAPRLHAATGADRATLLCAARGYSGGVQRTNGSPASSSEGGGGTGTWVPAGNRQLWYMNVPHFISIVDRGGRKLR
jgi:hypothetical protein